MISPCVHKNKKQVSYNIYWLLLLSISILISGKPSDDSAHPDYVPQIFIHSPTPQKKLEDDLVRYERQKKRVKDNIEKTNRSHAASGLLSLAHPDNHDDDNPEPIDAVPTALGLVEEENERLRKSNAAMEEEIVYLKKKLTSTAFNVKSIENNDSKTNFYTGLQTYALFMFLFNFVSDYVYGGTLLPLQDELFITLVKLRLNLAFEDLAHRAGVSYTTATRIFYKWLDILHVRLGFLIKWPGREALRGSLPNMFRKYFPKASCIIDCTEVFIDRPSRLVTRAQTWSNYKKHNTLKVLVAVTPTGSISFLSRAWGGKISDKDIVQQSGILDKLMHGDQVLADRGFVNEEDFAVRGATLVIPSFTKGRKQLPAKDLEESRCLASVRIEVERCIGLLKSKYQILKGPLPINLVKRSDDIDFATADKIICVCASLTNLGESIVNKDKAK